MKVPVTISKRDLALLRLWDPKATSRADASVLLESQAPLPDPSEPDVRGFGLGDRLHLADLVKRVLRQVAHG